MGDLQCRPGPVRRAWQRTLDGDRPWGSIDIRRDRFGVTRCRLVVYPPGLDATDRRRVRVARGWPLWGAVAWVVSEIWARHFTGPSAALAISTTLVLGAGLAAATMAGENRGRVRTVRASVMAGHCDPTSAADVDRLKVLAGRLLDADDRLRGGRLSPAQHETLWWDVYDELSRRAVNR